MINAIKGGNKMKFLSVFIIFFLLALSVNAFDFNLEKQDSGIVSGLEGETLKLSADGENSVDMKIDRVGSERVMFTLAGKTVVMDLDQSNELDLDNDGNKDVKLTLNNIIDKLVSLKFEKLKAEEKEEVIDDNEKETIDENEEINAEEITGNVVSDIGSRLGGYGKWIIGIVAAVIVLIIIIFVFKGGENSERFYNKAMDLHREGQEFHWDGDDETAEELYDKANEFREKARNMEGGF